MREIEQRRVFSPHPVGRVSFEPIVRRLNPSFDADTRGSLLFSYALVRRNIGGQAGTTEDLLQAIAAYREGLQEWTRERVPLGWAMAQNNLGNALRSLGERESGTARLEEAVAVYRDALAVFEPAGADHYVGVARANLAQAEALLAERRAKPAT